jgi:subtilisin family serine protease
MLCIELTKMRKRRAVLVLILIQLLCTLLAGTGPKVFSSKKSAVMKWDFTKINEMRDLAYVDSDSAELVVGVRGLSSRDYAELMRLIIKYEGKVVNKVSLGNGVEEAVTVDVPLPSVAAFVKEAQAAQVSNYIEPNFKFKAHFVPNDPYWGTQWGPAKIKADYAWNITTGNSSVLVAVVDTGIDWNHSDLATNYVALGYDWVNQDADPMDDNGHGTHVAGIIAASINNELGIAGLAQVSLMAEKVLNWKGEGYEDDLANAILHAADQGAKIISMSLGSSEDSRLVRLAVMRAYSAGVLLVASAGNDATNASSYPAAYDEVIAVTATDQSDNPAGFTNYGDWVELSAPGVNIYSTLLNDNFGYKSGTSMAAPHVSGVAALIWSLYPEETRDDVRNRLRDTADDLGEVGFDQYYGYGRVNAKKAVASLEPNIAITDVSSQKTIVGQGFTAEIYVGIVNQGINSETFNVTSYANGTVIQTRSITLSGVGSTTLTFTWNTTTYAKGNYTLSAYAWPVPNETNIVDNTLIGGSILVTLAGDVDGDYDVDIFDIVAMCGAYGSNESEPLYVSNYDINSDGQIDILDIVIAADNYGKSSQ